MFHCSRNKKPLTILMIQRNNFNSITVLPTEPGNSFPALSSVNHIWFRFKTERKLRALFSYLFSVHCLWHHFNKFITICKNVNYPFFVNVNYPFLVKCKLSENKNDLNLSLIRQIVNYAIYIRGYRNMLAYLPNGAHIFFSRIDSNHILGKGTIHTRRNLQQFLNKKGRQI